ncbi:hypothetical protein [Acinetobacter nosocomialis]|uniref:hypothetical protein n=1 Tax=Acinetobacter nosocomialis TaxID=106654 RepID=UPI00126A26FD|nr:hypothetical protein [Acinetobacter nosocomialis]
MDKPMTFNEWLGTQGNLALVHANCCRIAYEAGQQSQQAKVEELQKRVDKALELCKKGGALSACLAFRVEQALHGECTHESDGSYLLSDPPRTKCKKCGEFYFKALNPNNEVLRGQVVKKIEGLVQKNEQERKLWDAINGGEQALKGGGS